MNIIKSVYFSMLARVKYGAFRPTVVTPPGSPSPVHLNPSDRRALKKVVFDSVRGRISSPMMFWRDAVSHLQPDLAIDAGANYGECFSCTPYPAASTVLVIEANPTLIPFLKRTVATHPSTRSIRLVNCLVGAKPGEAQAFYFSPKWTGGGSAVPPANAEGYQRIEIPVDCLDRLLDAQNLPKGGSLVFKVDIEGYEGHLFAGFSGLAGYEKVAGIFEFDTLMLGKAGTPAPEVFSALTKSFLLFDTQRRSRTLVPLPSWTELAARRGGRDFHTDLVLAKSTADLPPGWVVQAGH